MSASSSSTTPTLPVIRPFDPTLTVLSGATPCRPYVEIDATRKSNLATTKWGQLKLIAGEIYWLVNYWNKREYPKATLVVIGAAKGNHYRALAELFPDLTLHLWDSNPFASGLAEGLEEGRILFFHRYFLQEDAETYRRQPGVFLSVDLRTVPEGITQDPDLALTAKIWSDHIFQAQVVKQMQPVSALLKFKLPYYTSRVIELFKGETVRYLAGTIYLQCFNGATSTETRLVPSYTTAEDGAKIYEEVDYNYGVYEQKLFFHNTAVRADWEVRKFGSGFTYEVDGTGHGTPIQTLWQDPISGSTQVPDEWELINSFDTMYLFYILDRYLQFCSGSDYSGAEASAKLAKVLVLWNWLRKTINTYLLHKASLSRARLLVRPDVSKVREAPASSSSSISDQSLWPTSLPARSEQLPSVAGILQPGTGAATLLPGTPGLGFFEAI